MKNSEVLKLSNLIKSDPFTISMGYEESKIVEIDLGSWVFDEWEVELKLDINREIIEFKGDYDTPGTKEFTAADISIMSLTILSEGFLEIELDEMQRKTIEAAILDSLIISE